MEEDDMDFIVDPNTSSNLASLFGINKKTLQGNSSLTYTAPKAPKRESSPLKKESVEKNSSNKKTIIISKAVQAYKLENRTYVHQGLTGIVISGNYESHIYEIILYKPSKEYICNTRIPRHFSFTVSPNNYATFYDDHKQNWSIMFQSPSDVEQFAWKITLCKFYSSADLPDTILTQDLTPMSQPQATSKDMVDVVYNVYFITLDTESKVKDSIKEIINLSDTSFTPLSKGLVGCSENSKRIIIIPHSLTDTWLDKLAFNEHVLLEVKIEKIISGSDDSTPQSKLSLNVPESPIDSSAEESSIKARGVSLKEALSSTKCQKANLISRMARMARIIIYLLLSIVLSDCYVINLIFSAEESSIKARGVSLKEALSSTKCQKANLISRMARMGQATLPLKQDLTGGPSDSEEECSVASITKPRISRNKVGAANSNPTPSISQISRAQKLESQQLSIYQNDLAWHQAQLAKLGVTYQPLIPISGSPISSPTNDPNLSVYVSESRVQAAELRMGISKMSEKLDLVWNKLQNLNLTGTENKLHESTLIDSSGVLSSIQALISENEQLKRKVDEQKGKIEQQNDRIFQLLELNHKYLEQNSTSQVKQSENELKLKAEADRLLLKEMEWETDKKNSSEKLKILEEEVAKAQEVKKELNERIEELIQEVNKLKKNLQGKDDFKKRELEGLEEKMFRASEMTAKLKEKLKEVILENENSQSIIKGQKEEIEIIKEEINNSRIKNEECQKEIEVLKKQISLRESESELKIEELTKVVAELEREKKFLKLEVEKSNIEKGLKDLTHKVLSNLKKKFSEGKEYSTLDILSKVAECFQEQYSTSLQLDEKQFLLEQNVNERPLVVPIPRTSIQNIEIVKKEKEDTKSLQLEVTEEEKKEKELKTKHDDNLSEKKNNSIHKSYDQSWRTTKPPPPPLFDDEDDDDDWLN